MSTLHSPSFYRVLSSFFHPRITPRFPSLSHIRLPLPYTLHKVAIYSRLSRPHSSFSSSPTIVGLPPRFSYPHRRGRRDTHQLRHSRVPSVHLPPAVREYSRGCPPRTSPTLGPLSFPLTCCAVGRSARRSAATGVANSLLATSAPLGRFRAPAGGIRQYAPRCLAGKLYVVNRFPFLTDTCENRRRFSRVTRRAIGFALVLPAVERRNAGETTISGRDS